jgi:hypothetical protein
MLFTRVSCLDRRIVARSLTRQRDKGQLIPTIQSNGHNRRTRLTGTGFEQAIANLLVACSVRLLPLPLTTGYRQKQRRLAPSRHRLRPLVFTRPDALRGVSHTRLRFKAANRSITGGGSVTARGLTVKPSGNGSRAGSGLSFARIAFKVRMQGRHREAIAVAARPPCQVRIGRASAALRL